jgi:hypothetical protein
MISIATKLFFIVEKFSRKVANIADLQPNFCSSLEKIRHRRVTKLCFKAAKSIAKVYTNYPVENSVENG